MTHDTVQIDRIPVKQDSKTHTVAAASAATTIWKYRINPIFFASSFIIIYYYLFYYSNGFHEINKNQIVDTPRYWTNTNNNNNNNNNTDDNDET